MAKYEIIKVNKKMKHPHFKHVRDLLKKIVKKKNHQSDGVFIKLSYVYDYEDEHEWYDCRGLSYHGEQISAVFGIEMSDNPQKMKDAYDSSGDENYYEWYY